MERSWVLLGAVVLGGCTFAKVEAASSAVPIMLSKPLQGQAYDIVGHFEIEDSGWGSNIWEPQIAQLVADKVAAMKGDAAINVKVFGTEQGGDGCLTWLVLGFARHSTTVIEGDAIKFK